MTDAPEKARLDVWLWRARFFRTRSLAAKAAAGGVRINGARVEKPAAAVRQGDVLTFAHGTAVRVVEVVDLGERRGPAAEARALYRDHASPGPADAAARSRSGPRPTGRDRRTLDLLRRSDT